MRNRTRIVAASLVATLITACIQPEPIVVVVTATPTPEERVDGSLARNVASPTPSSGALPTSTPPPTDTPAPVRLALDAQSTVLGYWSDGTADVEVTATLRNEGALSLDRAQEVTATCVAGDDERRDCRGELNLSLLNGFAPASESFTLRLPMGATTITFDYGEDEPLTLEIEVPERILGVDRDLWECYADRPKGGVEIDGEIFAGCGGWEAPTVQKWLNDVPVKVWATGHPDYIAVLETVLTELSPILNLEFEWVGSEEEADFKAYVGVPRSRASDFGFDYDPELVHYWGFAGAAVNSSGEATSGDIVIWHADLTGFPSPMDEIRGITIHEALHALGPIAHRVPLGHSSRPLSVMEFAKRGAFIPRERQLFEINSHPLVQPGMSMDDVRELIVLTEELLDYPLTDSEAAPADPLDLILRAYVELERAGSASFHLSGGWTDRACNLRFGVRRGPIEFSIADFRLFGDNPALSYLNLRTGQFYIIYSRKDQEWTHWQLSPQGTWERVDHETIAEASSWWVWNGKLHAAIRSVLMDGSPEDITVDETADGDLRIHVSNVNIRDWDPGDALDLTLVMDTETLSIEGYTWELRKDPAANPNSCLVYKEMATDGRLGVDIDVPESIRSQLASSP